MAGKVLGDRRHSRLAHAQHGDYGQRGHGLRIAVKGTIPDDLAHTIVEVDTGGKAEIHPHRAQFAGQQPADRLRERQGVAPVLVKASAQKTRGRKARKPLAKALHAAPFMVHRDQQVRRAQAADCRREGGDLPWIMVVPGEQQDAADQGMSEHPDIIGAEFRARDVHHERSQTHAGASNTAIDSTCVVCGNISITPALVSLNPRVYTKFSASRAKLPGWQEIYTTRRGRQCAIRGSKAEAPARGGSSSTKS